MNCKLGDLAFIVGLSPHVAEALDRVVRCVEPCIIAGKPAWVLDRRISFTVSKPFQSALTGQVFEAGETASFYRLFDDNLRPIRGDLSGDSVRNEVPADAGVAA